MDEFRQLEFFLNKYGGGSDFLPEGAEVTPQLSAHLKFESGTGLNEFAFRLSQAAGDTLIFVEEKYRYSSPAIAGEAAWSILEPGNKEPSLPQETSPTAKFIFDNLRRYKVYQFHNRTDTARIRNKWDITDCIYLKEDAAGILNRVSFFAVIESSTPDSQWNSPILPDPHSFSA